MTRKHARPVATPVPGQPSHPTPPSRPAEPARTAPTEPDEVRGRHKNDGQMGHKGAR